MKSISTLMANEEWNDMFDPFKDKGWFTEDPARLEQAFKNYRSRFEFYFTPDYYVIERNDREFATRCFRLLECAAPMVRLAHVYGKSVQLSWNSWNEFLRQMSHLEELVISDDIIQDDEDLEQRAAGDNSEISSGNTEGTIDDLVTSLTRMSLLKRLEIRFTKNNDVRVWNAFRQAVSSMPSLESVSIFFEHNEPCQLRPSDLRHLFLSNTLENLTVRGVTALESTEGDDEMNRLCDSIKECKLKSLALEQFQSCEWQSLGSAIAQNLILDTVILRHCNLESNEFDEMIRLWTRQHQGLTRLLVEPSPKLRSHLETPAGTEAVLAMLETNPRLEHLDLGTATKARRKMAMWLELNRNGRARLQASSCRLEWVDLLCRVSDHVGCLHQVLLDYPTMVQGYDPENRERYRNKTRKRKADKQFRRLRKVRR